MLLQGPIHDVQQQCADQTTYETSLDRQPTNLGLCTGGYKPELAAAASKDGNAIMLLLAPRLMKGGLTGMSCPEDK